MKNFKVGDKVYFPKVSANVFTVCTDYDTDEYPITVDEYTFTHDGKLYVEDALPVIYHATPENHKALEQLYGVEFEKPPTKPTSKEIIKALLDRGDRYVPCWVSDINEEPDEQNRVKLIYKYDEYNKYPYSCEDDSWVYATPFDIRTGQTITELPTVRNLENDL